MHVGVGVRVYARVVGEYVFDNFSKSNLIVVRRWFGTDGRNRWLFGTDGRRRYVGS